MNVNRISRNNSKGRTSRNKSPSTTREKYKDAVQITVDWLEKYAEENEIENNENDNTMNVDLVTPQNNRKISKESEENSQVCSFNSLKMLKFY